MMLFLTISSFAQGSRNNSEYRFAFVLSPQLSWISSDNDKIESNGSLFGYNFGIEADKFFAENYAISTGLTINTTGGKLKYKQAVEFSGKPFEPNSDFEYRLKYIRIPLGLKLQTNDFQRMGFYGIFGLSGLVRIKTNNGSGRNIDSEVNIFNLDYHFGGGAHFSVGGDSYIKFGIVYNQGITDVTDNKTFDDKAVLNRLVFNLGVIF